MGFFFAGSLALLYVVIALEADTLLATLRNLLRDYIVVHYASNLKDQVNAVFDSLPSYLNPLIILAIFLLLFATQIKRITLYYRDTLIGASGIYSIIDETSLTTARELITKKGNYDTAFEVLRTTYREPPVPEQLLASKDEKRLAYQMIWLNLVDINKYGFADGFCKMQRNLGLTAPAEDPPNLSVVHFITSTLIFSVLLGFYIIIVPVFGNSIHTRFNLGWPLPTPDGWTSLIRYMCIYTLALVFPLILGLYVYPLRRRAYHKKETARTSFAVVAAAQWLLSFLVLQISNVIDVAIAARAGQDYSLFRLQIHVSAFMYAFAPVLAFVVLQKIQYSTTNMIIAGAAVSASVGLSFGLSDVVYECYSPPWTSFYAHQTLLGLFITSAFFLAGTVTDQISPTLLSPPNITHAKEGDFIGL